MARRRAQAPSQRLILDSGAVIALARSDQRARAYLQRAIELDAAVRVPVVVLAETLRGRRDDAAVHRVIKAIGDAEPTAVEVGKTAGDLLGQTRRSNTVEAMVVAEAIVAGGGTILTGDPKDLGALASGQKAVSIQPLATGSRRRPPLPRGSRAVRSGD